LQDLEDTALVVEGIDIDRISDVTTNIIREPLIDYTQNVAEQHGIPVEQVGSGHTWDPQTAHGVMSSTSTCLLPPAVDSF
jgi:hypothetical protein